MAHTAIVLADEAGIARAADLVRAGGAIVYPTETVYGIGADPFSPQALDRVFAIKGRDRQKAIIILIRGAKDLASVVSDIPPAAGGLMQAFWPGPLTLVFRAHPKLPAALLGGGNTVAVRVSPSPFVRALLSCIGGPITSTSANPSAAPSARSAAEAAVSLGSLVDLILDGGPAEDNRPSTVVDISSGEIKILRPGRISEQEIRRALK